MVIRLSNLLDVQLERPVVVVLQHHSDNIATSREALRLTGLPVAPSWMRTFTISIGWMMQVAAMPDIPPLTKGLTAFHAAGGSAVCTAAIFAPAAPDGRSSVAAQTT